ncbi:MAG: enoyl-CoA hydratase/isomerase family protein [Chloroflexi bacterium]|nr:enoyl-CoA hydratase/isomerase family protein [Chloroflexota bacterium]
MPAVTYTVTGHIARVTLDRPGQGNVISLDMAQELVDICRGINQDEAVRVVLLAAAGETFCAGSELTTEERRYIPSAAIASIDRPVIAVINGDALGEGLEMALSCDIRLASDRAQLGFPQVGWGLMPWHGGTQRLPRLVGRAKALELLLTADTLSAAEACDIGLVNRVVPAAELEAAAEALAGAVSKQGPVAARYIKEAVNKGLDLTLAQGLRLEADLYFLLHTTADRIEGIRAFLEKRPPRFEGR